MRRPLSLSPHCGAPASLLRCTHVDPLPTPTVYRNPAHVNKASRTPALATAAVSPAFIAVIEVILDDTSLVKMTRPGYRTSPFSAFRSPPSYIHRLEEASYLVPCQTWSQSSRHGPFRRRLVWRHLRALRLDESHERMHAHRSLCRLPPHSLQSSLVVVTHPHPQSHPSTVDLLQRNVSGLDVTCPDTSPRMQLKSTSRYRYPSPRLAPPICTHLVHPSSARGVGIVVIVIVTRARASARATLNSMCLAYSGSWRTWGSSLPPPPPPLLIR
ncbi:hypothetical protein R3P38DRAFT_3219005 [Favolaschia claudopus]|uniref:Uncharacterized protein n=1 Tax=Favolaschia claudopus TaxID=2862362 RepID=A0AAW0A2I8_9AGAR